LDCTINPVAALVENHTPRGLGRDCQQTRTAQPIESRAAFIILVLF
jgi:hypothetical protein